MAIATDAPKLEIQLDIDAAGGVTLAQFVRGTGDTAWNAEALRRILSWKFIPAMMGQKPVPTTVRFPIHLQFLDPILLSLSEIECDTRDCIDSAYDAVRRGEEFDSVAFRYSGAKTAVEGGRIGWVDVRRYPAEIRERLMTLRKGEVSPPMTLGAKYVMFKVMGKGR